MTAATTLILVRHAETESNANGMIDSKMPGGPLNERGRAQAAELAASLAGRPVIRLLASPAVRTQETAQAVADHLGLPIETVDDLREIDFGDLEGRTDEAAIAICHDVFADWAAGRVDVPLPGGENWLEVRARTVAAVDALEALEASVASEPSEPSSPEREIVVVAHAGSLRVLISALVGPVAARSVGLMRNASHVVVRGRDGEWTLDPADQEGVAPAGVEELGG